MIRSKLNSSFWKTISNIIPETLLLFVFCFIQLNQINIDFWNDEIYTLKQFTFVSLHKTVTDYHVPNNHVFFNLINNLYLKLINIDSLHSLMDTPYKLRILPFIYSIITLVFTYRIGRKFFNRTIGLFSCIILITTIPYFNFALQIRGYGLSTLLLIIITYYYLSYLKSSKYIYLIFISLGTALAIYTIPSNIYGIVCIGLISFIYLLLSTIRILKSEVRFKIKFFLAQLNFHLGIAIVSGILFSLVLYSPIFNEVFRNEYVISGPSFIFSKLKFYTTNILTGMISGRWILIALALLGLIFTPKKFKRLQLPFILLVFLCFIPPLITYVQGGKAPLRVFVVFAPFFSLLFAVGIYNCWRRIVKHNYYLDYSFLALFSIYLCLTFSQQLSKIDDHILADIKEGKRSQNLYYQYYASHYNPLNNISQFHKEYDKKTPVLIHGCEPHGVSNYLDKFGIPCSIHFYQPNAFETLLTESDSIFIITNHPYTFEKRDGYKTRIINQTLSYHNILLLSKNPSLQ